jgi:cell shape-determining protein MreC
MILFMKKIVLPLKHAIFKQVIDVLHAWGTRKFGNVTRRFGKLWQKLENLQKANALREQLREIMDTMNDLLFKEEIMWLQRSWITGSKREIGI